MLINREEFSRALTMVRSVIGDSKSFPQLKNVLMRIKNGVITLIGTNLEITKVATLAMAEFDDTETTISIDAESLYSVISNLTEDTVMLENEDSYWLQINAVDYEARIACSNADEYPDVKIETGGEYKVDAATLKYAFGRVMFAAAKAKKTQREGAFVEHGDGTIIVTAMDGTMLAQIEVNGDANHEPPFISEPLTGMVAAELLKIPSGDVSISATNDLLSVCHPEVDVIARRITMTKPNSDGVLKSAQAECVNNATMDRIELIQALKMVTAVTSSSHVIFSFGGETINLAAKDSETGSAKTIVTTSSHKGDGIIGLNGGFVIDMLKTLDCKDVIIRHGHPSCVLINPVEDNPMVVDYNFMIAKLRV